VRTRFWHHAIVVGASSGIGEAIARQLAESGCRVGLVARRTEELQRVADTVNNLAGETRAAAFAHDVHCRSEVPALFQEITGWLGGLDLVVYAAAVQPDVDPNEFNTDKDGEIIGVNLTGCIAWCNQAAIRFERVGAGSIVAIGSIAGDRGRRGAPAYGASKSGLSTYLESLRNRLSVKGVRVTTVKPGFVDTRLTRGKSGLLWMISPDRAAALVLQAARKGRVVSYVPARWRLVSLAVRLVPSFLFRRLKI